MCGMKRYSLIAGFIIIIAGVVAIASAWKDSPIVDEIPHIGAGYSYIADHTFQFNPEHPPLAKDVAGLALLPLKINPEFLSSYNASRPGTVNDQWNFGRQLIFHSGVDPATIVHFAKVPLILFFILSGWLIFLWSKRTFNSRTGLVAVFLFAFSPTVIAHSRFVTTDVPALFGILFATYFFIQYLKEQSNINFWLASVSFGVALLTKFSTFLLIPYFLLMALVWVWAQNNGYIKPTIRLVTKTILIMAVGFIVIVGPIYQLQIFNYPPAQQKNDAEVTLRNYPFPILSKTVIWASDKPILRPYAEWGLGMAMVFQRAEGGNNTYFMGKFSNQSFKAYFPVVYVLKEPIPFLLLLLSSIWIGWRAWRNNRESFKNKIKDHFPIFAMLLWIFIYVATSINANLNIGIRHLIPIYGFIFILVAGGIERFAQNYESRIRNQESGNKKGLLRNSYFIILVLLLFWYLIEFISVYPYYLTYFNQFAGGPAGGHRYVVDSNLDWGQDLQRLDDFIEKNNIDKIYLDYFGWAEQSYYLGDAFVWIMGGKYTSTEGFLKDNPNGGWLGVSASFYQESTVKPINPYAWLKNIKPTAVIGNSIFVWYIAQ